MKYLITLLALTTGFAAQAGNEFVDCDEVGVGITSLIGTGPANARSFYNGAVSVYNIDEIEPACCSAGLAIVLPDVTSEIGDAKCVVTRHYSGIDISKAKTSYDPAKGLLLKVPTSLYNDGDSVPGPTVRIRINLKTSTVVFE